MRLFLCYISAEALWLFWQKRVWSKVDVWRKRRRAIREIEQDYMLLIRYGPTDFRQGSHQRSRLQQEHRAFGALRHAVSAIVWWAKVVLDVMWLVLGGLLVVTSGVLIRACRFLTGPKKSKRGQQAQPDFKEGAN